MAMTPDEIGGLVRQQYPDAFLRKALQGLYAAHRDAAALAYQNFADTEAENLVGNARRAYAESYVRGAGELVAGMGTMVPRIPGTGWNYTEVRSGNGVLVIKSVSHPGAMIDKADYRETLAEPNQPELWDTPTEGDPDLFVVLIHSRCAGPFGDARENRGLLGSAILVCPDPKVDYYLWELNLVKEFPEVVRANVPNTWDEEAVVRYMRYSESAMYKMGRRLA